MRTDPIAERVRGRFQTDRQLSLQQLLWWVLRVLAALLSLWLLAVSLQAQQDPFKRGSRSKNTVERPSDASQQSGQKQPPAADWRSKLTQTLRMPPWFRSWQRSLQAAISETALQIQNSTWLSSWHLYVLGMSMAIAFGFLHIAGPGHGKIFTISYFMSRHASLREGLWLSVLINIVDSMSAGLLVFLTYGLLHSSFQQGQWLETMVSLLSYGIILVWAIVHFFSHIFGHRNCQQHSHHSGKHDQGKHRQHVRKKAATCSQHSHRASHTAGGKQAIHRPARPAWHFALGVGLLPCPISTALLLFGLLNNMLGLAIYLVAGVSLGGILAMSLLSFAVINGKKGISSLLLSLLQHPRQGQAASSSQKQGATGETKLWSRLGEIVELLALFLMILMAAALLLLSWPV